MTFGLDNKEEGAKFGATSIVRPRIAVITVNFHTAGDVARLVCNLRAHSKESSIELIFIVVDNSCDARERCLLDSTFAGLNDVHLLYSPLNCGYAAGNNLGLKEAKRREADYSLIANSDIELTGVNPLTQLQDYLNAHPDCGLLGPKILLPNGAEQPPLIQVNVLEALLPLRPSPKNQGGEVYATVGCCIFGRTHTFELIGYMDERTFLYYEEVILAERLLSAGLKWHVCPSVVIIHRHHRKNSSVKRLLQHKKHEFNSALYYFTRYRNIAAPKRALFFLLFFAKLAIYVPFTLSQQFFRRPHAQPKAS